jgi:futalosine hydrolase
MERIDLVILGATSGEIAPLSAFLTPVKGLAEAGLRIGACPGSGSYPGSETGFAREEQNLKIAGNPFSIYIYRDLKLLAGTTGIGKVNAAAVASAVLSSFNAGEVWNVGCAGAYDGSGLEIGDVLIAESCICGDEGILGKQGPMPTSSLEIPLVIKENHPFYDCFPLDEFLACRQIRTFLPAGIFSPAGSGGIRQGGQFKVQYGASLTVSMTSGDIETAGERFTRFRALAENMEASAIAQTCILFDVPFLEIQGIGNMAGVRDKAGWDIGAAIENCHAVVKHMLDNCSIVGSRPRCVPGFTDRFRGSLCRR